MTSEQPEVFNNPWWGIWFRPRETIRWLVENDPKLHFWPLVIAYGIIRTFDQAIVQAWGLLVPSNVIIFMILIFGPVSGWVMVYVFAFFLQMTGRWFKGQATLLEIRTVYVWSTVPYVVAMTLVVIPLFGVLGFEVFNDLLVQLEMFIGGENVSEATWNSAFLFFVSVMSLLGFILRVRTFLVGYAEVQKFAMGRAVVSSVLGLLILYIPAVLLNLFLLGL